jgi:hypothetical protein
MKIQNIKGSISKIVDGIVFFEDMVTASELCFKETDFSDPYVGQELEFLCIVAKNSGGISRKFAIKEKPAPKPMKMKSFGSLIKQMIKAKERLLANLEEMEGAEFEDYSLEDLREKIKFLEEGIEKFS